MISVIIPAYDEEKFLPICLARLKECKAKNYEIIVVDAGSRDRTVEIARKFGCRVIRGRKNGVGDAKNTGARKARGGIIAFLDADSKPWRGWIDVIEREFAKDADLQALGGPTDYGHRRYFLAEYPFWTNVITKRIGFFYLSGTNSAYRKDFFLSQGGFRPICCEETEFAHRISRHWRRMRFASDMRVTLSPRRFVAHGFLRTHARWLFIDLKIFLGIYELGSAYGAEIKK